jgi:hypothetical protein
MGVVEFQGWIAYFEVKERRKIKQALHLIQSANGFHR